MRQIVLLLTAIVFIATASLQGEYKEQKWTSSVIKYAKHNYGRIMLINFVLAVVLMKYYDQWKKKQNAKPSHNQKESLQLKQYIQKLFGLDNEIDDTCLSKLNSELLRNLLEYDGKGDWYTQLLHTIHPAGIENVFNKSKELAAFCALELKPGVLVSHTELYKILFLCAGLTKDLQALELLCIHYANQSNTIRYGYNQQYTLPALLTILIPESAQKTECLKILEQYKFDTNSNLLKILSSGSIERIGNTHMIKGPQAEIRFVVNGQPVSRYNIVVKRNLRKIWSFIATEYPLSVHCHGNFTVEFWTGDFLDSLDPKSDRYFLNLKRARQSQMRDDEFYCYLNEEISMDKFVKENSYRKYIQETLKNNQGKYFKYKTLNNIHNKDPDIVDFLNHEWDNISLSQKIKTEEIHKVCKEILFKLYDSEQRWDSNSELEWYQEAVEYNNPKTYEIISFDPPQFLPAQSGITPTQYLVYVKRLIVDQSIGLSTLEKAFCTLIQTPSCLWYELPVLIRALFKRGVHPESESISILLNAAQYILQSVRMEQNLNSEIAVQYIQSFDEAMHLLISSGVPLPPSETYMPLLEKLLDTITTRMNYEQRDTSSDPFYIQLNSSLKTIKTLLASEQKIRDQFVKLSGKDSIFQNKILNLLLTTIETLQKNSTCPGLWIQQVLPWTDTLESLLCEQIFTQLKITNWNESDCLTTARAVSILLALTNDLTVLSKHSSFLRTCIERIVQEGDCMQVYEPQLYFSVLQPVLIRCIKRINEYSVPSVFKCSGTNIFHIFAQSGFDNKTLQKAIKYIKQHHSLELLSMLLQKKQSPTQFLNEQYTPLELALKYSCDQETGRKNKKVDSALQLMKQGLKECVDFYEKSNFILPKQFEKQIYKAKKLISSSYSSTYKAI